METIKKNSVVELEIEDLAYGGAGVARANGFVVFVQGALPGDRVLARIVKKKKQHAEARVEEMRRPADNRVDPPCPIFDICGGCTWQDLAYEDQLVWKRKQLIDALERIGGLENLPEIPEPIASPEIWNYRNKMEYSFGTDGQGGAILGFHHPGRFDRIFAVERCLIHPQPFDAMLRALTEYARENDLDAYNQKTHQGFLRHAVMRYSRETGGVVLALITNEGELPEPEKLAERLKAEVPGFQGMLWGVNTRVADVAQIDEERMRWGDLVLIEQVNGLKFRISPQSFFQTNTSAAERLYRCVVEMAQIGPQDVVMDAYCGAGAIGLHCARQARRVVGVDIVREAIFNARDNARINGIDNATFLAGHLKEKLPLARQWAASFSRVIIDPPRGGMDKKSLRLLLELRAPVFVYVSCNPATLARDLQTIGAAGYDVEAIQPVDMFPHTFHQEAVVRLRLRSA